MIVAACIGLSGRSASAASWKPVSQRELALTAADIGDPDADAAILFREGGVNDTFADGTSLRMYIRIKIFNERGRRWADVQLPYRVELGRITDVHARTIRPDGTPFEVDSRDVFDKLLMKTSHGIWRAKVFSMPAVEPGSIIEYRYRQIYPDGFRYFALDLQSDLFTLDLFYRIEPPLVSKLDMRWITFNARDSKEFTPQWDGSSYYIKASNIPAFRREPMMPPERAVKIWGWLYYTNGSEVKPEKYWRDYSTRAFWRTESETKPTHIIKRIVDTITLPNEPTAAKIARIYDYVQAEIKNVGYRDPTKVETVPDLALKRNNSAEETLIRRYGTPVEINRLFVAMLRACGLDARVAELTTRDELTFHRGFVNSFQLNSEVTAVLARGSIDFYDPGTLYCPIGMLAWEKEAVPVIVHGNYKDIFAETPLTDASRSGQHRVIRIGWSRNGSPDVSAEVRLVGQRAVEARNELASLSPEERVKRFADLQRDSVPGTEIDESAALEVDQKPGPLILTYKYDCPRAFMRTEKRVLIRPALIGRGDEPFLAGPRRVNAVYFPYPWSEIDRVEIAVPTGSVVEQLPDPIELDIGVARYRASFSLSNGKLIYERVLRVGGIYIAADQYDAAKAFFDRVHNADHTVISLRQN